MKRKILSLALLFLLSGPLAADSLDKAAKTLSNGAKKLSNRRVAVLPFPYHDGRQSQGSTIVSERFTTYLVGRKKFEVIERSLLENVFKELKLQVSGAVDGETSKQIGKLLGVEAIINGTLIDLEEDKTEVNARLILVESGQIVSAASAEVDKQWTDFSAAQPQAKAEIKEIKEEPAAELPEIQSAGSPRDPYQESIVMSNHPREGIAESEDSAGFNHLPDDAFLIESDFVPEIVRTPFGEEFVWGMRLIRSGKGERAYEHFMKMLSTAKNNKEEEVLRLALSSSLFAQGKTEKAIKLAREVAHQRAFPRMRSVARYLLGKYYEKGGDRAAAQEQYLQVVREAPFHTRLVRSAGRHLENRRARRAIRRDLRHHR